MSCTVIAVPVLLFQAIGAVIAASAAAGIANDVASTMDSIEKEKHLLNNDDCDDVHVITAKHFMEKSFETVFMDKDILIKTLEEHGVVNIKSGEVWESGKISGQVGSYNLNFTKESEDKPYFLTVTCLDSDNAEEKLNDLSGEYALNVQEETYLSIVDKLKDNNMELESEEVLDDNTIVLTVNLD